MEQSTPIYNKAKGRRRTLMRVEDTPITSESVNDEFERTSRRSIIEIQKKAQVVQSPALNESVRFSGEQEMKDHLQICTKLYAENKITTGIAWQLHIIDLLGVMSKKQSINTLQVASTSLDIGAKVYGLRVDDLHAEGLKLANSMARFAEKNEAQDKGDEHQSNDEEYNEDQASKKKKKRVRTNKGVKNTIVKDRSTLLGEIPQLESVFFSNRIDSNLSTVDNLFTNSLPMDKSCYKLLALGEDKAWVTGPDEALEGLQGWKSFDVDLLPKEGNICVPFQNFILNQYDVEEEEQSNADKLLEDVVVYDNEGFPVAELDGSIHDVFNDNNYGDQENDDEAITEDILAHQIQHDVPRVVDLITSQVELKRSEYSYNSVITLANGKVIDQIWAGPSHWKLKFIRRDKSMFSGRIDEAHQGIARPKKKLKRREPEPIDFLNTDYAALKQTLENMKKIKIKKRIFPANKITLPLADASCRDMLRNMHELMIKPGTICMPKSDSTVPLENTRNDYSMNELQADNQDIYDDEGTNHIGHDPDNYVEEEEVVINRQQNFMGDNLVDAPESVARVYIPYALQAKKMDMKKLKAYTWQLLAQNLPGQSKKVNPTTFSTLFRNLPSVLPQTMRKELTCSLAFSALLHLCNEENLKLTQMPNFKDFNIESG